MWKINSSLILSIYLIISVILCTNCEIHRAKNKPKIGTTRYVLKNVEAEQVESWKNEGVRDTEGRVRGSEDRHSRRTWVYSLVSASLVGLSGIFPLLVIPLEAGPALRSPKNAGRLQLLLSFAVGGLLGDVFLHLLPEAWAHVSAEQVHSCTSGHCGIGLWIIGGLLIFMVIEKAFPEDKTDETEADETPTDHTKVVPYDITQNGVKKDGVKKRGKVNKSKNSSAKQDYTQNGVKLKTVNGHQSQNGHPVTHHTKDTESTSHIKTCGWLNLAANIIDNYTHGLAVAGSYCVSYKVGVLTTAAILLHEVPHEIGDFAILLRAGFNRWEAAKAQLLTASGGLMGALTALLAESAEAAGDMTAWVLPFTSGGFLYIALVSIIPELLRETDWKSSVQQVLLVCAGIGVMCLVTVLC